MIYQPFMIADFRVGLRRDVRPFLLPEDAFPDLKNSYLWRGRIYKKGGNVLLGRLGVRTDNLANRGAGVDTYNFNTASTPVEPGSIVITDGVVVFTDNGIGGFVITGGAGTVNAPINYTTGAINITFNNVNVGASVTCNYIVKVGANSPAMGLLSREIAGTNEEGLVAFDLITAYEFSSSANKFINKNLYKGTTNIVAWTGTNSDFFTSCNYQNALFTSNNIHGAQFYAISGISAAASAVITLGAHNFSNGDIVYINNVQGMVEINNLTGTVTGTGGTTITVNINSSAFTAYSSGGVVWSQTKTKAASGDGIRWYDGSGWVNFAPPLDNTGTPNIMQGAAIILPYHDHLVCLSTTEGTTYGGAQRFAQRARYSQNGNVYYAPPLPTGITSTPSGTEWYEIPGRGGFIDATTAEEIVAAEFIKDVLVVYFEQSTWKLVFTGNQVLPFVWEKINTEVGSESQFSVIPFDKEILSVGQNGIYHCNSVDIDRIDRIIPDEVFNFENAHNGNARVCGIRDFYSEFALWSYGNSANNPTFPDSVLAYNYVDQSWSIFENSYTCFGYYHTSQMDLTWDLAINPWQSYDIPWNSYQNQSEFPIVVGGNQQGFVFQCKETDASFPPVNDTSLVIQNISNANPSVFTVPNHNLQVGQFVKITGTNGLAGVNGNTYFVYLIVDANNFSLLDYTSAAVSVNGYTYGGFVTVVDNFNITTKSLNPFFTQGLSVRMGYADLYVDNTENSSITVEMYLNDDNVVPAESHTVSLVDPNNAINQRFWTRVYFESQASFLSLKFTYSTNFNAVFADAGQIFNEDIVGEFMILNALNVWMSQTGRIVV